MKPLNVKPGDKVLLKTGSIRHPKITETTVTKVNVFGSFKVADSIHFFNKYGFVISDNSRCNHYATIETL